MIVATGSRLLPLGDRSAPRLGALAAAGLASLAVSACGGSSHPTTTKTTAATTSKTTSSGGASSSGVSVTTGPVHATLVGQTHQPVARKRWTYTVTATDAHGRPLSGTVLTEFAFEGTVVGKEVPPVHKLKKGLMRDVLEFPAEAVGQPIDLQAVVRTPSGSVTLRWPVMVHK